MKILVRTGTILRWAQGTLFACAVLMLSYCAFVLADTRMFQHRAGQQFETRIVESAVPPIIGPNGLVGRLEIARLGISVIVMEGTEEPVLQRAAGHIAGTGLPGQPGNVGIAAHRDTFFRPLRNIERDDIVTLTTLRGEYRYRVISTKVTSPSDVAVLNPTRNEILTLVTCYPFYFIGPAPDRFVVRAERLPGASPKRKAS